MAGIDKSDFHPPGRPQLSSTIEPHLDGAASLSRGDYQDVRAKTDASSLVRRSYVGEMFANDGCDVITSIPDCYI